MVADIEAGDEYTHSDIGAFFLRFLACTQKVRIRACQV